MIRFLLIVSVLCALGAAGLGFLNRAKLAWLSQELIESRSSGDEAGKKLKDLQQNLQQTEDRLSTQERLTQQERDARTAELNSTKAKLNQATEQLTARDSENKALTAALTEAGRNVSITQEAKRLPVRLGSDAGVGTNSRLTVVKNGKKLTQLRVVSVEPIV